MRQIKTIFAILGCSIATLALNTACLSDNPTPPPAPVPPLTQAEKNAYIADAAGSYEGFLYYNNDKGKTDSVPLRWTITAADSAFTVQQLSLKPLERFVTNLTNRALIAAAPAPTFKSILHPFRHPRVDANCFFASVPDKKISFTLNRAGNTVNVHLLFNEELISNNRWSPSYISLFMKKDKRSEGVILPKELQIDNQTYPINTVWVFKRTKN